MTLELLHVILLTIYIILMIFLSIYAITQIPKLEFE